MPLAKDFNHTFAIDGHILACGISPCSWMYDGAGTDASNPTGVSQWAQASQHSAP